MIEAFPENERSNVGYFTLIIPASASAQSDQYHCYQLSSNYNDCYSCSISNFSIIASLCSCADWFKSYMVGNPEDRFFHYKANL